MNIDLNSFDREKAIDQMLAADAVDLELENARVDRPIAVKGEVIKASEGVKLLGRMSGSLGIDCDRCLESVERSFDIELDLAFAPSEQLEGEANIELRAEDMKLDAIEGSQIDLVQIAIEQILLDLPQQFFCRIDCKGLCEKCGTNLNLKDCDCGDDEIDPRWAALHRLN